MKTLFLWTLLALSGWAQAASFDHSHHDWSILLERHVQWTRSGVTSEVDYPAFAKDRTELDAYLLQLSSVSRAQFEQWSRDERLAFLINAYNAFTVQLILDHYPIESIKEIGNLFRSPWKRRFISLLDETLSLDDVEHGLIRQPGRYDEPRIHFVVNCASLGCPALRPSALTAVQLDEQLNDSLERFLRDRQRNRFDPRANRLEVSRIFDWYAVDFERKAGSVWRYLADRALWLSDDPAQQQRIRDGVELEFLDYDWRLNEAR
ncbi:DUF547 domain-containing protein [Stutzerimonas stutzeri]|uniref:DUF547 domain-containing protein n=1 Tax=Stutzerimonas stutzeri TaxID=316 RepID=UPI00210C0620|nr:DUF547 domain-containing protein [Stutzerimonas stutzeri]MCQ4260456.1 DUF547 domain-containing protein [Stutzerimonas stutzeri]